MGCSNYILPDFEGGCGNLKIVSAIKIDTPTCKCGRKMSMGGGIMTKKGTLNIYKCFPCDITHDAKAILNGLVEEERYEEAAFVRDIINNK